jgi:hypothetical protein
MATVDSSAPSKSRDSRSQESEGHQRNFTGNKRSSGLPLHVQPVFQTIKSRDENLKL